MGVWLLRFVLGPILFLQDCLHRFYAWSKSERVLKQAPYHGGRIAVIALYQSGHARPDILRALLSLRRRGVYTIVVNSSALEDGGARLPCDCYAERQNYGRDFASYQCGLKLARQVASDLPDLILCNDSVYYLDLDLDSFWERLFRAPYAVCGATDSREVKPHLMSYCLRFSQDCARSDAFRSYWDRYIATNLRPLTIFFGEIGLSQSLSKAGYSHGALVSTDNLSCMAGVVETSSSGKASAPVVTAVNITHSNPDAVVSQGAPVIKLDLVAKGAFLPDEIDQKLKHISTSDSDDLMMLLNSRHDRVRSAAPLTRWAMKCGLA